VLREWVASIEEAGFVFLRHQTLRRSHALAFATAPLTPVQLAGLSKAEPPQLIMRREIVEGGEWHDLMQERAHGDDR